MTLHTLSLAAQVSGERRPRAILFDWDNTLIDSWGAIQDAQNHTLTAFGLAPWTLEETKARVHGSMRDSYPQLFGDRWLEAGEVLYRRFEERHMETLTPLAGASSATRRASTCAPRPPGSAGSGFSAGSSAPSMPSATSRRWSR